MTRSGGLALAFLADELLGDPRHGHPVAGFGAVAAELERRLYRDSRAIGAIHTAVLVAPLAVGALVLERRLAPPLRTLLLAAAAWASLGGRTLRRTAVQMADLIDARDLDAARALAPALVARRPEHLDSSELVRAALESVAENTGDAVAGPLLWAAVGGSGGVLAHRAVNTLDAMVGYRSPRYRNFGWCAARLDDVLAWPAARIAAGATVAAAAACGEDSRGSFRVLRRGAGGHASPNAGLLEAAFAGGLGITLGGTNDYGGRLEHRPLIGDGPRPDTHALRRAVRVSAAASQLLVALAIICAWR